MTDICVNAGSGTGCFGLNLRNSIFSSVVHVKEYFLDLNITYWLETTHTPPFPIRHVYTVYEGSMVQDSSYT